MSNKERCGVVCVMCVCQWVIGERKRCVKQSDVSNE